MEHESKEILRAYKIPITKEALESDVSDAVKLAKKIEFPIVLEICSPNIIHKSDIGGVAIGPQRRMLGKNLLSQPKRQMNFW